MKNLIYDALNSNINISSISSKQFGGTTGINKYKISKGMRPYSRFFFVLNGTTVFSFETSDKRTKTVKAQKGDIVYLPTDIPYTSYWIDPKEIDHISIEFTIEDEYKNPILLSDEIFVIVRDKYNIYSRWFFKFHNEYINNTLGSKLKCRSIFFDILHSILSECLDANYRETTNSIYKGIMYIDNNCMEEISVKDIASICNMCETSFRQKFKKAKGMSPIEYKNYLKITKAAELLKGGEYTITEAAQTVNIPDIYYFSKLFKKYFSVSPREYIKNM